VKEDISREQIYFSIRGKYYVFQASKRISVFTSLFLNSNLLLDQEIENIATLKDDNYPFTTLSTTPNLIWSANQPAPQNRLNTGITFGSKFFLLKDQLFLEPELGWQLNLLQLRDAGILAALNLGYRLR